MSWILCTFGWHAAPLDVDLRLCWVWHCARCGKERPGRMRYWGRR